MGFSTQERDPETSKPHKLWACWSFPTRYAQDYEHHLHCSGVQDAAVLAQVQTHAQMVLSLSSNPQEWISAGSRDRSSDRRTHLVPMRNAKVKLSLLLLSAGREKIYCECWVVQHEKKSLILTLNA